MSHNGRYHRANKVICIGVLLLFLTACTSAPTPPEEIEETSPNTAVSPTSEPTKEPDESEIEPAPDFTDTVAEVAREDTLIMGSLPDT